MVKKNRLRHGVRAKISVYIKFLHPRTLVCNKLPNAQPQDVLTNCVAIAQEVKTVSKRMQTCIVMHHDLFDNGSQIHAGAWYCKVIQEGAVGNLFQIDEHADLAAAEEAAKGNDCAMQLPSLTGTTVEDISHFYVQGFEVDDDNDPAPENVPAASTPFTTSCIYSYWGSNTLDPRRINNLSNYKAVLWGFDMATKNCILAHFLHFYQLTSSRRSFWSK